VLKASLYLSESLPIQYKVKNFTKANLRTIEANWEKIKACLSGCHTQPLDVVGRDLAA